MKIKRGLCEWCHDEIYIAAYGAVSLTMICASRMSREEVDRTVKDNGRISRAAEAEYHRLEKETITDCVIVADYFDDFAQGDGQIDFLMCKKHLKEAIDLLGGLA